MNLKIYWRSSFVWFYLYCGFLLSQNYTDQHYVFGLDSIYLDITDLGRWGDGDAEGGVSDSAEIEDLMFLIKQALFSTPN